jgi:hypothetical protein
MAAMTMVWEPLTRNKVQSFPEKQTLNHFSNVYYSLKNGPRSLKLGLKFAETCPLFIYSRADWLCQLHIGTIADFLRTLNSHEFFTFMEVWNKRRA